MASSTLPQDFGYPLLLEDYLPVPPPSTHPSTCACNTHPSICATCHTHPAPFRCSQCKNAHYCTAACHLANWPDHKLICKTFATAEAKRPNPSYRLALWLPTEQSKLGLVYLAYGTDGTPLDLAKCFSGVPREDVKTIAFQHEYLPYWVQFSYDSNPSGARSLANNASVRHAFRGPMVAIAYDHDEGLSKPALDVDTAILGPVLEYAQLRAEYEGPIFVEQPQKRYTEEEWTKVVGGVQQTLPLR